MINDSVSATIDLHYDLHVPKDSPGEAPLLIAIHGYAAHKTYMMREAKLIAPKHFAVASLQGPNRFFRPTDDGQYKIAFGWLSDYKPEEQVALHHDFVLKVIDALSDKSVIDPSNVFLYGFSQACALNFRFAFTHADALKGIIGVCGGIPSDLDTNEKYVPTNAETLYLYGDDDEFYPPEKFAAYKAKLQSYLPKFESRVYQAKHVINEQMRDDMRSWLVSRSASEIGSGA